MFKSLITTLLRFRTASSLNVIGLSVAYAAFVIIAIQVTFERGYGRDDPNHREIFRVESPDSFSGGLFSPRLWEGLYSYLTTAEPAIIEYASLSRSGYERRCFAPADSGATSESIPIGGDNLFTTRDVSVYSDPSLLFSFDMLQGSFERIMEPSVVVIPLSLSEKLFGRGNAIGQSVYVCPEEGEVTIAASTLYTVVGVYRDLPVTSILPNGIYYGEMGKHNNVEAMYVRCNEADTARITASYRTWGEKNGQSRDIRLNPISDIYYSTDLAQHDIVPSGNRDITNLLIAIALLIISIAAINFVNFSTALAPVRLKGLNTRIVMGQTRGSLRRMLVGESLGLSLASYAVSFLWISIFNASGAGSLIKAASTEPADNMAVVVGVALVAIVVGVVSGIYPAYYSTRFETALVLKGSGGLSHRGKALRTALIGFQYVISIALIIGATFIWVQNSYLRHFPRGYAANSIVMIKNLKYDLSHNQRMRFLEQLRQSTAVEDATYAWGVLGDGYNMSQRVNIGGDSMDMMTYGVLPNFFNTMGMSIVEGRDFLPTDLAPHPRPDQQGVMFDEEKPPMKVIVNRKAQQSWSLSVDSTFSLGKFVVIGVVDNISTRPLYFPSDPACFTVSNMVFACYIRLRESTPGVPLSPAELDRAMEQIKESYKKADLEGSFEGRLLNDYLNDQYVKERDLGILITMFALLVVIISLVGVFGLVLFETQYRRREIGLRKVHGASVAQVIGLFGRSFVVMVGICFLIAAPMAWWAVERWLEEFAYRTPIYWWVFAMALLIVLTITILTVLIQSWRAATANPVESLKSE